MALAKILYRDLLHAAKQFDRSAALRALLSTNLLQRPVIHETSTRLPHVERFNRAVLAYLDNRSFYVPSTERSSLTQLIHEQFRAPLTDSDVRVRVDTAFVALKALNDKLAEAKDIGVIDPKPQKKLHYRSSSARATASAGAADALVDVADVQHAEYVCRRLCLLTYCAASHPSESSHACTCGECVCLYAQSARIWRVPALAPAAQRLVQSVGDRAHGALAQWRARLHREPTDVELAHEVVQGASVDHARVWVEQSPHWRARAHGAR